MECYTTDALLDMARPTFEKARLKASEDLQKAHEEERMVEHLYDFLSPIVPIYLCYVGGLRAAISVVLKSLPLENAIDMMQAELPVMLTELKNGGTYPTETVTEREREGTYRDVAAFYIHAQYDIFSRPQKTEAKLMWWSHLGQDGNAPLVSFTMPLLDAEDYLRCQYATETPRSKKVRFNSLRTRLPNVQLRTYSGGDRNAPKHFYLNWDMSMDITKVIDGIHEEFHAC